MASDLDGQRSAYHLSLTDANWPTASDGVAVIRVGTVGGSARARALHRRDATGLSSGAL